MSSLNTSLVSSTRLQPSARCCRRLMEAAQQVQCQACYSPLTLGKVGLPKPHPCLFCSACLGSVTSRGQEKYHRFTPGVLSNSSSQQSDITAWGRGHHGNNDDVTESSSSFGRRHRRFSCNEVLLNASLKSTASFTVHHRQGARGADDESSPLKRREFAEKLRELEVRATRCGLCQPWMKRRRLATYCVQCRKYICQEHTVQHRTNRYTRLHGTVNLVLIPNDALL